MKSCLLWNLDHAPSLSVTHSEMGFTKVLLSFWYTRKSQARVLASSLTDSKNSQQGKKKKIARKEKIQVGTINGENQRYMYFLKFLFGGFLRETETGDFENSNGLQKKKSMQKSDSTSMRHHWAPCHSCAGVPLPAFTACKLRASLRREGARLLLRSRVWGRGRDSSSVK